MAFLEVKNVRVAGFSAGVPQNIRDNALAEFTEYTAEDFIRETGVKKARISGTLCTSDLCYAAAEKLISDLNWDKREIEALVFVSQTSDYILPATACILQDRLGLSKDCFAQDIVLGCSGWVYGLATLASLMQSGTIKRALLLCGDAKERPVFDDQVKKGKRKSASKKITASLFGAAGTVTALEYTDKPCSPLQFCVGTDGSGFDAIITPDGGSRCGIGKEKSFKPYIFEGKPTIRLYTVMKGMDVFSFGITTAPKNIKKTAEHFGFNYLDADFFVFHQANKKMNDFINKKLKLPQEKVPVSLDEYGNTSSASIPLTIVARLQDKLSKADKKIICCGFGVGLSWGTACFVADKDIVISDLVEVADSEVDRVHIV
jgi:3-oxoacyl-[acyl-carrier-protein] synthase-3